MSKIERCRSCGGGHLVPVLSLGRMPLANALVAREWSGVAEPTYPLETVFCPDCSLVQTTETIPPDAIFREYSYFSSFSDTFLRHAEELSRRLVRDRRLGPTSLVVEIASNDGYLLQYYKERGVPVLGIEPARNVAQVAIAERSIPTIVEFFDSDLATRLAAEGRRADVVHAHNVLAHVPELNGVVAGMHRILAAGGVAVIETPYVRDLVDGNEFDTIYHEHLCYFSLTALDLLFSRHGLTIVDVERIPIHGGSLRIFLSRHEDPDVSARVSGLREEEDHIGLTREPYYSAFASRVLALKDELRTMLLRIKEEGKRIAAYGAAAKGCTLLNFIGIGRDVIGFVADRSPHKQGRVMPGVHIPIVAPDQLVERMPDYTLLLTWNFADEILAQQAQYRALGGRFIVPIPAPRIV